MPHSTVSSAHIGILFALPEETVPFVKRANFPPTQMAVSGVGRQKSARCVGELIHRHREEAGAPLEGLILCGFAGGLATQLLPGSLVIADRVLAGETPHTGPGYVPDSRYLALATSLRLPHIASHSGPLITLDRIVIKSEEKQLLAKQTGAVAVDMETAGAVRVAQEQGIPWLAVRVITDGATDDMPLDFNTLADAEGNMDRGRIVRATLTHPWKIPALIRLGQRSALAAENLACFLQTLLQALPDKSA